MKLLIDQPLQINIYQNSKVIIIFPTIIYFSQKEYIQQFIAKTIIGQNPQSIHYDQSKSQVLLVTSNTIQIFHTNWQNFVQLKKIITYNAFSHQPQYVLSVNYDNIGWRVYGKIHQYGDQDCEIVHVWKQASPLSCFKKQFQFIIQDKRLYRITHSTHKTCKTQITWKQRLMAIANCKDNLSLAIMQNSNQTALCLGQTYILMIKNDKVLKTIQRNHIFYFGNDLIVSGRSEFRIDRLISGGYIQQLGQAKAPQGIMYAVRLFEDQQQLFFLHYYNEYLMTKRFKLIVVQSPTEKDLNNRERRKSLHLSFQNIAKIIPQQANQSGSMLLDPLGVRPSNISLRDKDTHRQNILQIDGLMDQQWEVNLQASQHASNMPTSTIRNQTKYEQLNQNMIQEIDDLNLAEAIRQQQSFEIKRKRSSIQNSVGMNFKKPLTGDQEKLSPQLSIKDCQSEVVQINQIEFGNKTLQDLSQIHFKEGDLWGQYMRKTTNLDQVKKQQILQGKKSLQLLRAKKKDSLGEVIRQSQKVQTFALNNYITPQLRSKIQQSSYSELLMEINRNQNTKKQFQNLLIRFLPKVIQEKQAPSLFSQHIRSFNKQQTKQLLSFLYSKLQDTSENKSNFSRALSQLKVSQVPKIFTRQYLPDNIVEILQVLHPDLFMMDIYEPNSKLFSDLLQDYMGRQQMEVQQILIEDQMLDITHPRNILNVLLYLDQTIQTPLPELFSIYFQKILRFGHIQIIRKIIQEENVLQICQISLQTVQNSIKDFIFNSLRQSSTNLAYIYDVYSLLEQGQLKKDLQLILSIIDNLIKYNLSFSTDRLFEIKINKNIGEFIAQIIAQNSVQNLVYVDLNMIYQKLWNLQQSKQLENYTFELINLTQILAEKLANAGRLYRCFALLDPISSLIKRGFVSKILIKNFDGKLVHRLFGISLRITPLHQIFPQIFGNPNINQKNIKKQIIPIPRSSQWFSCSWNNFETLFQNAIFFCQQIMKYVIYQDIQLAMQMVQEQILIAKDFENLIQSTKKFLKKPLPQIHQNPPLSTVTLIPLYNIQALESQDYDGNIPNVDPIDSNGLYNKNKIVTKSLININKAINHFASNKNSPNQGQQNLQNSVRAKSDKKQNSFHEQDQDDQLQHLRFLVQQKSIILALRQIYNKDPGSKFLISLSMIEKKRVKLYHKQQYKALMSLQINFCIQRILLFDFFLIADNESAFLLIKQKITSQIDITNFWVIYQIIQILFGQKQIKSTIQIFIRKLIFFEKNDLYCELIKYLIQNYQELERWVLEQCRQQALKTNLLNIYQFLNQYILAKNKQEAEYYEKDKNIKLGQSKILKPQIPISLSRNNINSKNQR